jgi:DNA invertase Pin-like site-specific DNA recombinase
MRGERLVKRKKVPRTSKDWVGLRAAMYARMSTDLQKYSIQNQADAIKEYAIHRGFNIVRDYVDEGRSGLRMGGREALQALISDVQDGRADFSYILVYDVSRWGRFQDADESAYYEFICKEAGVQVLYCAEQFENDGSVSSTILKNVKRAMAGEYSRELSTKVFVAQCRMVKMGFWRGGTPGFGLRRQLVDENRKPKTILEIGQRKSLQTDRIVLVPGPPSEVRAIRRIFASFVVRKKSRAEIAADLNADKILNERGNPWSMQTIDIVLRNESYIGHNVFNRRSFKLHKKHKENPRDMWVRCDNAFKAIVSPDMFAKAQKLIAQRHATSDKEMLDGLSTLLRKRGRLSATIIAADGGIPHSKTYTHRFGSLINAYEKVGFRPPPQCYSMETAAKAEAIVTAVAKRVMFNVERHGRTATYFEELHLLTINEDLKISVCVAFSINDGPKSPRRWQIRKLKYRKTDLVLVIRMDVNNSKILDYYWFPTVHLALSKDKERRITARSFPEKYRHDNLNSFYLMCRTTTMH